MKKQVAVTSYVEVEIDETKFTQEFMEAFSDVFYPFETIDEHIMHIAQMEARDILRPFTEGYGEISDLGISARVTEVEEEIEGPA